MLPAILKIHIVYVFENGTYKFEYMVIFITEEILTYWYAFCMKQQARGLNISLNVTVATIRIGLHPLQVRLGTRLAYGSHKNTVAI